MATNKTLFNQISTKKVVNTTYTFSGTSGSPTYAAPVIQASVVLVSGSATFAGGSTISGVPTDALNMTIGQPINLTAANNCPIGSFTVDASAGAVNIVLTFLYEA